MPPIFQYLDGAMENVCELYEEAMFTNVAYIDLRERVFSITTRRSGA